MDDPRRSARTLSDVIHADETKPLVSEEEWVVLVRAIAEGDELALHELYGRAHRPVFTLIIRITANRETAEELTLDVFHDVWRKASRYDPANGTVLGWIMNQARSRALDQLRFNQRKKRVPQADSPPQPREEVDGHELLEFKQQSEAVRAALVTLTTAERQAIEAAFFSELTHAEIAERLNEPLGTIKTRIRSGLQKLRQVLATKVSEP